PCRGVQGSPCRGFGGCPPTLPFPYPRGAGAKSLPGVWGCPPIFPLPKRSTEIYRGRSIMATRDILDRQAGTIEYVLHTHGIRARVDGGKLSPRLAHFHLVLPAGVNPTRLSPLVPEIAGALGVLSCRLAVTEGG